MKKIVLSAFALLACHASPKEEKAAPPIHLGAVQPLQFGPDIDGGYVSQEVIGLWAHPVPQPTVGSLQWDGGSYYWSPNAGSISPGTAGQALFTNDAGTATQWATCSQDIACSATTIGQMALQSVTPTGGTSTIVPFNAGGLKASTSPWVIQDSSAVQRLSLETAHGRGTFGGGGTDYAAAIGPMVGFETSDSAVWLVPNATALSATNYAIENTSTSIFLNAISGAGAINFMLANASTGAMNSSAWYVGGAASNASPFRIDYSTATTPLLQCGTSATSCTFGSNKSGAVTNLQADAGATVVQLAGGTQNTVPLGVNFSTSGHIRTPSGWMWQSRNAGNSANNNTLYDDGSNNLYLGNSGYSTLGLGNQGPSTINVTTTSAGITHAGPGSVDYLQLNGTSGGAYIGNVNLVPGTFVSLDGAVVVTTRTITGNLTVDTTTTDNAIIVDTTSAAVTVTLPTPTNGRALTLIDKANTFQTHNCTLARHASEKINGFAGSIVYSAQGTRATITSDGTDWYTY